MLYEFRHSLTLTTVSSLLALRDTAESKASVMMGLFKCRRSVGHAAAEVTLNL